MPTSKGEAPMASAESETSIFAPRMLMPCNREQRTAM
jgi:hypothetical protein